MEQKRKLCLRRISRVCMMLCFVLTSTWLKLVKVLYIMMRAERAPDSFGLTSSSTKKEEAKRTAGQKRKGKSLGFSVIPTPENTKKILEIRSRTNQKFPHSFCKFFVKSTLDFAMFFCQSSVFEGLKFSRVL